MTCNHCLATLSPDDRICDFCRAVIPKPKMAFRIRFRPIAAIGLMLLGLIGHALLSLMVPQLLRHANLSLLGSAVVGFFVGLALDFLINRHRSRRDNGIPGPDISSLSAELPKAPTLPAIDLSGVLPKESRKARRRAPKNRTAPSIRRRIS